MSLFSNLLEELKIPKCYAKELDKNDRFLAVVHRSWLRYSYFILAFVFGLLYPLILNFREFVKSGTLNDFIHHETLSSNEVQAKLKLKEPLGLLWQYVLISVSLNRRIPSHALAGGLILSILFLDFAKK